MRLGKCMFFESLHTGFLYLGLFDLELQATLTLEPKELLKLKTCFHMPSYSATYRIHDKYITQQLTTVMCCHCFMLLSQDEHHELGDARLHVVHSHP